MATDNEIRIIVSAEVNKALANLKRVKNEGETAGKKASQGFEGLEKKINAIGAALTAGVLLNGLKKIVKSAADFQQLNIAFSTFLGSATKAKKLLGELDKFANITPFTNMQVNEAAKRLLAFGIEGDKVIGTLKLLGDVASGTGKDLAEMAVIFGQIKSTGRLMGQDLLQLINAGFNPLQEISKKTGVSMSQLKSDMERGLISFDMVENAFRSATSEGGTFFNLMEAQSKTFSGRLSTLQGNFDLLVRKIGQALLPVAEKLIPRLESIIVGVGELNPLFVGLGVTAAAITPAIWGLYAAFGPLGAAIAVVTGGTVLLLGELKKIEAATEEHFRQIKLEKSFDERRKKTTQERISDLEKEKLALIERGEIGKRVKEIDREIIDEKKELEKTNNRLAKTTEKEIAMGKDLNKSQQEINASYEEYNKLTKEKSPKGTPPPAPLFPKPTAPVNNEDWSLEEQAEFAKRGDELDTQIKEAQLEKEESYWQELNDVRKNAMQEWFNASREITNNIFDHRIQSLEAEKQAIEDKVASGIITEEQGAKEKKKLDREIAKEKRKQAIADRVFAISQIAIETAQGIAKAWAYWSPLPGGQIKAARLTALLAGIGIAQTATVASQPMPQYAMGTDYAPAGRALVGEAGPEIVEMPAGSRVIPNYAMGGSVNNSTTTNQNYDNKNITINVQATNFEDFVRQAQERFGRRIFT